MLKEGEIYCDNCQKRITQISDVPAEGWPTMHNLCSDCFKQVRGRAVPR